MRLKSLQFIVVILAITPVVTGSSGTSERGKALRSIHGPPSVTRLKWSNDRGIATFHVRGDQVWLTNFGSGANLWRVQPRSLGIHRVSAAPHFEIFAPAARSLWGTTTVESASSGSERRVVRVPLPARGRMTTWPIPRACRGTLGSHSVTFGDALWLDCRTRVLTVRAGSRRTTLRAVTGLQAIFAARSGLWLVEGRRAHAVAGRARGSEFLLPAGFAIQSVAVNGDQAWVIGDAPNRNRLVLLTLQLGRRSSTTAVLQTNVPFLNNVARVGREIWAGEGSKTQVLRFDLQGRLVGSIRLRPSHGYRYRIPFVLVNGGAGFGWVSANRPPFAIYRISEGSS